MELYKYVTSDRIDILTRGFIRFSQPIVWNDPFELQPFYKDHKNKNPFYLMIKWSEMYTDFKKNGVIPSRKEIEKFENERKRITKDDIYSFINKQIVGLTLTEDNKNLLMWSHYAAEHSGFVIEFDLNSEFFKNENNFIFKVNCQNERPIVNTEEFSTLIFELTQQLENNEVISSELYSKFSTIFTKSKDWEYEKEWRILSTVKNASNYNKIKKNLNTIHITEDNSKKHFVALFKIPMNVIKAIYCGNRMKRSNLKKLFQLINNNSDYSHIELFKTALNNETFDLNFEKLQAIDVYTIGELEMKKK